MPKTASKRSKSRRAARVSRAHQTAPTHSVVRRARPAARRQRPRGIAGLLNSYPWASTFFALMLIGGFVGILYTNHLWLWAPSRTVQHSPTCDLKTHKCDKPAMTINQNKYYIATIKTAKGDIVIEMNPKDAPITVNNFVYLAEQHFFDGLTFHRVERKGQPSALSQGQPSSLDLIQGGDPAGNGTGGPGYSFNDEKLVGDYVAGAVAMANSGPNTNGSQFFICTGDDTVLPKQFNLFGHVTSGIDVAQKIVVGDKIESVTIAVQTPPTPVPAGTVTPGATSPTATP